MLAGEKNFSTEERRQRISYFFWAGLTVVFVCLDLMSLAHKGFSASVDRCHDKGNLRLMAIFFMLVLRLATSTAVFTATACLYVTEPDVIALAGLGAICIQVLILELWATSSSHCMMKHMRMKRQGMIMGMMVQ